MSIPSPKPARPPTPPTRQYQLIPIRNQTYALSSQNRLHDSTSPFNRFPPRMPATNGTLLSSFGKNKTRYDQSRRTQYIDSTTSDENPPRNEENDIDKRQTAYYYNELRIDAYLKPNDSNPSPTTTTTITTTTSTPVSNADFDDTLNESKLDGGDDGRKEIDDEVARNTRFNANIACTSSASLDSIV